jgi:hypothetical protein
MKAAIRAASLALMGLTTASGALAQDPGLAAGSTVVAYSPATGLVASTGNLYWTANDVEAGFASVWRASKQSVPGSETLLYQETAGTSASVRFGDIVFASVAGQWHGYFIASYQAAGGWATSFIKRVPLGGGPAETMAPTPAPPAVSLATDGADLFWSDGGGLRRMPLAGGAVVTLAAGTALGEVALDGGHVYYAEGTAVRRVPKAGGPAATVAGALRTVRALYAHVSGATTTLYFGDSGGAVQSRRVGSTSTSTHQAPTTDRRATSVGFDGVRVLWADCAAASGSDCVVKARLAQWPGATFTLAEDGVGTRDLQWDSGHVFWIEAATVERHDH